jgi:hypothetical protein
MKRTIVQLIQTSHLAPVLITTANATLAKSPLKSFTSFLKVSMTNNKPFALKFFFNKKNIWRFFFNFGGKRRFLDFLEEREQFPVSEMCSRVTWVHRNREKYLEPKVIIK